MKSENPNRELWIPLEILSLVGISTTVSTNLYVKIASSWGPIVGGLLIWFLTPLALVGYSTFYYKRIIPCGSRSRLLKSATLAILTIVINYSIPVFIYGPYSYGPGP